MRKFNARFIILATAFGTIALWGSISRGADAPASPATQPATTQPAVAPVSIRGHVSIAAGVDLAPPDLSRVVIYVASDPALDALPLPSETPQVAQHNKRFNPNFLIIPIGTVVEFPNWDHYSHNVFSRSKAAPAFDLERYPYGTSKSRQFTKLGVVQVFCNVHPEMRAMIFVAPNGFFTRAESSGRFELRGLPSGRYEIVAWHERCEEQRQSVEVRAGNVPEIAFQMEPNRQNILASDPPEHRKGYAGVERGLGIKREKLDLPVVADVHPAPAQPQP